MNQQLLLQDPATKNTNFSTLSEFVGYFKHLSDKAFFCEKYLTFGSKNLLKAHSENSCLFVEKYVSAAIPNYQLEYLFESIGLFNYDAEFGPKGRFKHVLCDKDGTFSELFIPNIAGDRYNPYIRYKSSQVSGSQQTSKLLTLAGTNIKDMSMPIIHDNVFNLLVLTFPSEIGFLLLDPSSREDIISRMWRCYNKFYKQLFVVLQLEPQKTLGSSASLHVWSSEFPFMPHPHFHMVLPHFFYNRISKKERIILDDIELSPHYEEIFQLVKEVKIPQNKKKDMHIPIAAAGVTAASADSELTATFIKEGQQDKYNNLLNDLSIKLGEYLGFESLPWYGSSGGTKPKEVPLNVEAIKQLWTKIVYKEFDQELDKSATVADLDIHTQFCKTSDKSKLLHNLQYKTRPPVLDLHMFLEKCEGFVTGYNELDPSKALDLIRSLFVKASLDNDLKAYRYDSILCKAEKFFDQFSVDNILDWLRFLCTWVTQTKVFGFWRNIKRYQLEHHEKKILIKKTICPLCDGVTHDLRYLNSICFDSIILRVGGTFQIYNLKIPPPEVY